MSLAQRSKPYRYAQAKPIKQQVYKLPALATPPVYSSGIAANEQHIAVGYGSSKGSVLLLPTQHANYKPSSTPFTISAHGCELGDLAWNPFTAGQLATGAADGTVKLWQVPSEGLTSNITTPVAKFDGLDTVHSLAFHPSASGVLAAGVKTGLNVFDLEAGKAAFTFGVEGFGKDVTSVHWSRTGNLLAAVTKNATLSVIDPRTAEQGVLAGAAPNTLVKKLQHGLFIGGEGTASSVEHLLLFGVSSGQQAVMTWVDPRKPGVALKTHDFPFSQGYSLPIYEPDTGTLFYTVRGSEQIALLDVESEKNAPTVWPSHTFGASGAVKGHALLPKAAVETNICEVNRVFTLGAEAVEGFSITVPRKTAGFHAELFPDTAANKPAQSGSEYLAGADKAPLKMSMVTIHESGGASAAAALAAHAAGLKVSSPSSSSSSAASASAAAAGSSPSGGRASSGSVSQQTATRSSVGSVSSPPGRASSGSVSTVAYVASEKRAAIDSSLKKSVFTHCTGKEPASNFQSYFDLKPASVALPLAENIRTNGSFFAIPWKASGGSALAVFRLAPDALGRAPPTQPCVRGHKYPASSFDFSPFEATQLASGCVDGTIMLWRLPEGGLKADLTEPESTLTSSGKVSLVRFHPTVSGILFTAASSFDGNVLEVWDVSSTGNQSTPASSILITSEPEVPIIDFSVHPKGHLLAVTTRDGKVNIVHIASKKVTQSFSVAEGVKDTRVLWLSHERVLTVGFGPGGVRSMSVHDASTSPARLLQTVELDRVPYLPLPRYDPDAKLLFLANAGGTFIPLFSVADPPAGAAAAGGKQTVLEQLNMFQTSSDTTGFVLLPKRFCDVRKVEVQRALKLTKDSVLPIVYSVPRKRLEFFQDDLFPPTRQAAPELTAAEFLANKYPEGKEPTLVSMQPADMTPLSEAPEEALTEKQLKYNAELAKAAAPKPVGALGHTSEAEVREHFIALQGNVGGANRWDARVQGKDAKAVDVGDDEWD